MLYIGQSDEREYKYMVFLEQECHEDNYLEAVQDNFF